MNQLDRYTKLKSRADALARERDRAKGELDGIMKQLAKFKCDSIREAKQKLRSITNKMHKIESELKSELDKFEEQLDEATQRNQEEDGEDRVRPRTRGANRS